MEESSKRNSFLLYKDSLDVLDDLTDEQAGQLFKAIKDYQDDKEISLSQILKVAFTPLRNHMERDKGKYKKICERNRINGLHGGRPRNPENPVGSLVTQINPKEPKKADSDSDSDSDSENKKQTKKKANGFDYSSWPELPSKQVMDDWVTMRNRQKANVTQTVVNRLGSKLTRAVANGYTVDECLSEVVIRNWRGFDSSWMPDKSGATRPARNYV